MGAGERPAAELRVERHRLGSHPLDHRRSLAIPELTDVEVTVLAIWPFRSHPAEEDVAGGLHQALAFDHPPTLMLELTCPGERLQHRALCFLRLEEQRVL